MTPTGGPRPARLIALAALLAAVVVRADDAGPLVEEIVVVASRTGERLGQVAANVTVLSRADLDLELAQSTADMFRYLPGIDPERAGTRFGTEGISIRGIGGNRVATLIDGVPLGDQFDVGTFSNATRDFVDAGFVQHAEVLHGPASAIYGSSAIGGVVALRTANAQDITERNAGGRARVSWSSADGGEHVSALGALAGQRGDAVGGISVRSGGARQAAAAPDSLDARDTDQLAAFAKLSTADARGNTWTLGYYHQHADSSSTLGARLGSGRFRTTTALSGDDQQRLDAVSGTWEFDTPGGWIDRGVARLWLQHAEFDQQTLDIRGAARVPVRIARDFEFEQRSGGLELQLVRELTLGSFSHRLALGMEYRQRRTEEQRNALSTDLATGATTNVLLGETFPLRDFPITDVREWGLFIQDTVDVGQFTLIAALRADRHELEPDADTVYREDYPFAQPVSLSDAELSPKFGVVWHARPSVDLFVQYAHGFRAPPFEDANLGLELPLFNVRALPNPDLRSESSDGLDVGIRWQNTRASAALTLFSSDYDDFIETRVRIGTDPASGRELFQSRNVRRARIRGAEARADLSLDALLPGLAIDARAYYARGDDRTSNRPLDSVGPAQAVMGLGWHDPRNRWSVRLRGTLTAAWSRRDNAAGDLFEPSGHAVFDLYGQRKLGNGVIVRLGIMNVTDRTHWSWTNVRGLAPDDPALPYLSQPGRNFTAAIEGRW